ncbi:hypothetical protein HHK36_030318 [Tetracentron sinense]|uniref:Protein FAR1-RELATED SEQUENCE n=1 Tax=Tetracentron sinense TaxID=13715 RepID=A0A835CYL0_TETSI|nr:hypothetical protein HHK36_030318 [Tetracentron sinense]
MYIKKDAAQIYTRTILEKFQGYLCRHILKIFACNDVQKLPPQYVLKRWTRDTKSGSVIDDIGEEIKADCHDPHIFLDGGNHSYISDASFLQVSSQACSIVGQHRAPPEAALSDLFSKNHAPFMIVANRARTRRSNVFQKYVINTKPSLTPPSCSSCLSIDEAAKDRGSAPDPDRKKKSAGKFHVAMKSLFPGILHPGDLCFPIQNGFPITTFTKNGVPYAIGEEAVEEEVGSVFIGILAENTARTRLSETTNLMDKIHGSASPKAYSTELDVSSGEVALLREVPDNSPPFDGIWSSLIGEKCGALLEVDSDTLNHSDLRKARI